MLSKITCAAIALATLSAPLAARADDAQRLLGEQRFTTIQSFKLTMVSHSPQGEFDKTLTYVAPDRLRLDIPKQRFSAVTIGNYIWLKRGDGHWKKIPAPKNRDPLATVHSLTKIAAAIKGKNVTFVGNETVGGVETHVYKLDAPPKPGYSAIQEKLWLGTDGYPRKIEQRNGPFSMLATYSDFNAPLTVAGP